MAIKGPALVALALASAACQQSAGRDSSGACIKKVLVIVDENALADAPLAVALSAAGYEVTTTAVPSSQYDGVHPSLAGEPPPFGAVVVLCGDLQSPYPLDMPEAGQKAILDYVNAGHGLVLTEWAAFHVAADPTPRWKTLAPLVLLSRTKGHSGQVTYQVDQAFLTHPIWSGLPASFTFMSTSNVGTVLPGARRVAYSPQVLDAVAIREGQAGRVVHLAHAGTHVPAGWSNINVQRLMLNAVGWAAQCN